MELLKVILWQVAVTFNLPTTDPEAKIKVFPTTYFQMLSLLQSTERASSSQVSSECSYSFLLRLSWLLCKVIKFFLHSTWRAWWYDLMWVLSIVGRYSWWGFKNPPALGISWPCHHLIWYLGVKPWGRAIFLMRCHYLISSWSRFMIMQQDVLHIIYWCCCRERAKSTTFLKNIRGYMGGVSASAWWMRTVDGVMPGTVLASIMITSPVSACTKASMRANPSKPKAFATISILFLHDVIAASLTSDEGGGVKFTPVPPASAVQQSQQSYHHFGTTLAQVRNFITTLRG